MRKAPMLPSCRLIIAALIIVSVNLLMMITLARFHWLGRVILVVGMIFLALVIMVRKEAARAPIWFVVLLTIAVQLPQLFLQPRTSDDAYRYIWDGRVLLAGVDPYRFVPLDSALAGLRLGSLCSSASDGGATTATKALKENCRWLWAATLETTLQLKLLRTVQA
jgi:hypothetical protein